MSRRRTVCCMGIALVFALLLGASLRAQTASTSTVTGTVYDKSGATVPNAQGDLEDVDTKAQTSTTAANDGVYAFPSVRPGNYNIARCTAGFRESLIRGARLEVGHSALVILVLQA